MTPQEILDKLTTRFDAVTDFGIEAKLDNPVDPYIKISPNHILEVAKFLRDDEELLFDFLSCLSGIDLKGKLAVAYQLFSTVKRHKITLKVEVATDAPNVQSVESIWKSANWHEREAFDLYGINFIGHPDLRRILLPYDWEGHPLRKDYQVPEYYNGMKVPY
ncbi:MAG: NADH-quinone oxidoreductase subunit C [Bacteroidota bacterium]